MSSNAIDRRSFIKAASLTTLSTSLSVRDLLAEPGKVAPLSPKPGKRRSAFRNTIANVSGIPLGGIGTGSVELRPDGYFDDWLIFNMGSWSPEQPEHERGDSPSAGPGMLQFFARVETKGQVPKLRRLGMREDQIDLYSLSYAHPVQAIEFDGKFPFATLQYVDDSLPVTITGLAFSPIIPHDSRTSGTPGFTMAFKVRNNSQAPVKVCLMGALQNPLAAGSPDRKLTNKVRQEGKTTFVELATAAEGGRKATHGSMCLSVTGGKASHVGGTYRWYLGNGGWGGSRGFGSAHYSYLHAFYRDGVLPSHAPSSSLDHLLKGASDAAIEAMSPTQKQQIIEELTQDIFFAEFKARVLSIQPDFFGDQTNVARLLKEFRDRLNSFSGGDRTHSSWGDAALASTIELAPGEEKEVRFALSWFFPNHFSALGPKMGHRYEEWFKDAAEVNRFLVTNHAAHRAKVVDFAEAMLATNLDPEVAFSWGAQLTTLIKSSWWTKDGRFAIWEGLGCCGLHTTDITYQGSYNLIALFPDLQLTQMQMGASYQRADGRIHHFFAPDLMHVDNGFDRVDMNPQFVMMVCRDYLWTNDRAYLTKLWPNVVRAMASTNQLDGDGDGIPDRDTRRNTYDQWDLEGSPAYIVSLWLGALMAGIRIADALGEKAKASEWKQILDKAETSFARRLWNGEYFNLWATDKDRDECCMSDQLSGQWYTNIMGLGHAVPATMVRTALRSVFEHNFDSERGLINASYPPGRKKHFKTHQNLQAAGNWTGIEYAIAAMMIDFGLTNEGLSVIQSVHDRHVRTGHRWRHEECGSHYYRAMSSWTTMLALTGFRVDAPSRTVSFAPKLTNLVAPWFSTTGYGTITVKGDQLEVTCTSGRLDFTTLKVPNLGSRITVSKIAGAREAKATANGDEVSIHLGPTFTLPAGKSIRVSYR